MPRYTCTAEDRKLFQQFLGDFLPPDIFDAHAHLYRQKDLGPSYPPNVRAGPEDATYEEWFASAQDWMGEKLVPRDGLFFPFPATHLDVAAANRFLFDQIKSQPGSRGLMMVRPKDDPAAV